MSTPCEKLGYEEGMRFTLVNDDVDGLSAGDTLWLHSDDGSSNPEFRNTEKVNDDTDKISDPYFGKIPTFFNSAYCLPMIAEEGVHLCEFGSLGYISTRQWSGCGVGDAAFQASRSFDFPAVCEAAGGGE